MNNKDTVLIIYSAGSYGTFIEWCLSYFSGDIEFSDPFVKSTGSAHSFIGHPLDFDKKLHAKVNSLDTEEYLNSNLSFKFARTHGRESESDSMDSYLEKYTKYFKKVIFITFSNELLLLRIQNIIDKIKNPEQFTNQMLKNFDKGDIWEKREAISFWFDGAVMYPKLWNSRCKDTFIELNLLDFVSDPMREINTVLNEIGMENMHPDDTEVFTHWRNLQKHINKDKVSCKIINSVVADEFYDWSTENLNIYDEAYIQSSLRTKHGIALKCFELNEFPTNTTELRKLLIYTS